MCFDSSEVISRCALRALCVRDSKAFHFSAPGFNLLEEQGVLSLLGSDP